MQGNALGFASGRLPSFDTRPYIDGVGANHAFAPLELPITPRGDHKDRPYMHNTPSARRCRGNPCGCPVETGSHARRHGAGTGACPYMRNIPSLPLSGRITHSPHWNCRSHLGAITRIAPTCTTRHRPVGVGATLVVAPLKRVHMHDDTGQARGPAPTCATYRRCRCRGESRVRPVGIADHITGRSQGSPLHARQNGSFFTGNVIW